jgi:hypothetical protein
LLFSYSTLEHERLRDTDEVSINLARHPRPS